MQRSMKIGLLSDVHAHRHDQTADVERLVDYVTDSPAPDLLVLAGDISHVTGEVSDLLGALSRPCPKCWVPGNHDIWVIDAESAKDSAAYRYEVLFPGLSRETGWHYLPGGPLLLNDFGLAVVGTLGWFSGEGYSEWFDAPASDRDSELAIRFARDLEDAIHTVPAGLGLIVVTHHLAHRNAPTFDPTQGNVWNRHLEAVLERHRETIALVIHGHRHSRYDPAEIGGFRFAAHPFGYPHQHETVHDGYRMIEIGLSD